MVCFRDMTFCEYWQDCAKASACARPLTPEVRAAARKWWGSLNSITDGAPISVFVERPDCHVPVVAAKENP